MHEQEQPRVEDRRGPEIEGYSPSSTVYDRLLFLKYAFFALGEAMQFEDYECDAKAYFTGLSEIQKHLCSELAAIMHEG